MQVIPSLELMLLIIGDPLEKLALVGLWLFHPNLISSYYIGIEYNENEILVI